MWFKIKLWLCKIGLHDWSRISDLHDRDLEAMIPNIHSYCRVCGEVEGYEWNKSKQ